MSRTTKAKRARHIGRRRRAEIRAAEERYDAWAWYIVHRDWAEQIKAGKIKLVDQMPKHVLGHCKLRVEWEADMRMAALYEQMYGFHKKTYPLDPFAAGVIAGKLAALRWARGLEWLW